MTSHDRFRPARAAYSARRRRPGTVSAMWADRLTGRGTRSELACGVAAAPLFVGGFTAIGAARAGYDWRRHAVSSLAAGTGGWWQRANFMLTGALYCVAAHGLARSPSANVGPRAVPALAFAVGAGLVGSGLFVTDPVAGFPPSSPDQDHGAETALPLAPTRSGELHNLFAIPIFAGIPAAALTCGVSGAKEGISMGLLLGRLGDRDGSRLRGVRGGVRRQVAPGRAGRCLSAHLDRDRIRMAERIVAPRSTVRRAPSRVAVRHGCRVRQRLCTMAT